MPVRCVYGFIDEARLVLVIQTKRKKENMCDCHQYNTSYNEKKLLKVVIRTIVAWLICFNLFDMTKNDLHTHTLTSFLFSNDNNWCISLKFLSHFFSCFELRKKERTAHLRDVISSKSTFTYANPCLIRILDKLFVLVLHHLSPNERMTTTTRVLSILILTCICLQNNG